MAKKSKTRIVDKDLGFAEMMRRVKQVRESYVDVGVLEDSSKGGAEYEGGITVAENAAIQEFGTNTIPSRPFLRSTFDRLRGPLTALGAQLIQDVIHGRAPIERALNIFGSTLATEIKKTITDSPAPGVPPPNAPSTIRRKMKRGAGAKFFKKPPRTLGQALAQVGAAAAVRTLVDTGRLLNAITWTIHVRGKKAG